MAGTTQRLRSWARLFNCEEEFQRRNQVLLFCLVFVALPLFVLMVHRALTETGFTNTYAVVAHSFLTGTPFQERCFDHDCVKQGGKYYVIFPPFPGLVAMPLVALFGIGTKGFIAIAIGAWLGSLFVWTKISNLLSVPKQLQPWFLAALAFASPLYLIVIYSQGIWFFAQALAFPLVSVAIYLALKERLVAAGFALTAAFLCRQMSILYVPILFLLARSPEKPLLKIDIACVKTAMKLCIPVVAGVCIYLAYNYWRFGGIFITGYFSFDFPAGLIRNRVYAHGVWSKAYFLFNFFYLFLQGFHADFDAFDRTRLVSLDDAGTSILAASPWLLLLFFTPKGRALVACGLLIIVSAVILLFYHSNGWTQYNTQRYTLDWMPAALFMLASVLPLTREVFLFRLLVLWGAVLNVATFFVLHRTS